VNPLRAVTRSQTSAETNPLSRTPPLTLSLALFLALFSVYLLTYSPRFHSSDGLAMFATAESLVRRGEWDADQIRWMGLGQGILGIDGHLYIRKGVGVSLLALPLVWLGLIVPIWGSATTTLLFNAVVTAATSVLLLRHLQVLGYDNQVALVAGLVFGLATPAWPYAKTFFSDPLATLCLVAAALALLHFRKAGRTVNVFWAGLALAVAVAARYANAVMIPLFALLLIKYQIVDLRTDQPSNRPTSQPANHKSPFSILKAWIAFGAPLAITAIAIGFYNLARYGDPLNTGYLPEESFSGIWWRGIFGLLVSPGRGLFLYAPVLLIALLGAPAFFRRHRAEATLAWAIILTHLLLYGKWFMWHGGYAWGPRFMVPTLPFFIMGMAPAIERTKDRGWWQCGLLVLAALSGLIQVLGLSVHFELFQNRLLDTGLPLFAPITFFAPRYSPLIGQFQFLRPENLDFAWITDSRVEWPLLTTLIAAVLFSVWGLIRIGRSEEWKIGKIRPAQSPNLPTHQSITLPSFQSSILPFLVILAATILLLTRAHALHPSDLRGVVDTLNAHTTVADAVVTGTPGESVTFADLYKGRADVLGLDAGAPLDADTVAALTRIAKKYPRVWWLPNWLPPEESGVETWLMRHGFRAENWSVGKQRLALYYFPSQPLSISAINANFGDDIVLEGVATLPVTHPGEVLPVALTWETKQRVPADYHVFVHLLDARGNRVAQSDGQPALWTRPTTSWAPGEHIEDRHALSLPADLPPGDYTLVAGLYLPESGERLLTNAGEMFAPLSNIHINSEILFEGPQ
jgi:hypothetical protein